MASVGLVDLFGAPTGAQSADVVAELVSADASGAALAGTNSHPSVSDDGTTVVFTNSTPPSGGVDGTYDLVVRRRATDATPAAVLPIPVDSADLVAAAISGDGCTVAYSAVVPRPVEDIDEPGDGEPGGGEPGNGEPGDGELGDGELGDGEPGDGELGDGELGDGELGDGEPGDGELGGGEPGDGELEDDPAANDVDPEAEPGDPDAVDGVAAGFAAAQVAADVVELRAVDVCPGDGLAPTTTVLDRLDPTAPDGDDGPGADSPAPVTPLSRPALSADGTKIAFATTASVRLYDATSTPETPQVTVMAPPAGAPFVGERLDMTADGATVVFEAGPLVAGAAAEVAPSVYIGTVEPAPVAGDDAVVDVGLFAPSAAGSSWPSISADGSLVVYQSDQQLPIEGVPAEGDYVVVAERPTDAPAVHRLLTTVAVRPDLSADGTAVVYDIVGSVQMRRSESTVPFADFSERIVNPRLDVEFDEGAGATTAGAVISADGSVAVFDQPPAAALSAPVLSGAHVWAQATAPLFAPPPTSTTIDNTTTTTIAVTQPTVATTPNTTRNTVRSTTRNTVRSTTRNTTRATTRSTTRATTATTASATQQVAFTPAAFEFAPTIVGAGTRTAAVQLSNPTSSTVTVTGVAVDTAGATDFTTIADSCPTIAAGSTCAVQIVFAPTDVGERTATVVATLSDGSTATVALRGVGAPEPVLAVVPEVASNGQVVTVVGSGFPAGASIEFTGNGGSIVTALVVDDQGGFTETMVVLPNTMSGPLELSVAGQTDLFGDVEATLLVSDSSSRGNTAIVSGGVTGASLGN